MPKINLSSSENMVRKVVTDESKIAFLRTTERATVIAPKGVAFIATRGETGTAQGARVLPGGVERTCFESTKRTPSLSVL